MTGENLSATFGVWVRTRRKQLDLTQSELGKRAGCSEAAIRKIEADERKPSRQLAELLIRALELQADENEIYLQFARGIFPVDYRLKPKARNNPHNLPALLTSTIDRTRDLANVRALLKSKNHHLVTLIGPPGIGKTRLSIHCGNELLEDFPDGVWFVDLADLTKADYFVSTITRCLPFLNQLPSSTLSQLLGALKEKVLLLILDNFEQIVEDASLDVSQILKTCPNIKILATSRAPLHIYGEYEYQLPPLSFPPADVIKTEDALMEFESVQLFVARMRQHQSKFAINPANAPVIVEICTLLEGIPLALELVAATLHQMTFDELIGLMREKGWVKQISTPARDLPPRQRTLENVINWSFTLLNEEQRTLFCRLGVFSGWFDAEAASFACEISSSNIRRLIGTLLDHSLLVMGNYKGQTHWRMLELIREFAVAELPPEELDRVELLRANYYLNKIQTLKQSETREAQDDYFQTYFSNIHGALKWTAKRQQIELGFELASELDNLWASFGYFKEGLDLMRQLLAVPSHTDPRLRFYRLQSAADLAWQQHDFDTALALSDEAVELCRSHGLSGELPAYLNRLGRICIEQNKLAEAKEYLNRALELTCEDPSIFSPGAPLAQLGEISFFQGNLDQAKSTFERALSFLSNEEPIFVAITKTDLAEVELALENFSMAHRWLVESFEPASQHIRRWLIYLSALAGYLLFSPDGNHKNAAQIYGAIETLSQQSGVILGAFYQELNQWRLQILSQRLTPDEFQRAIETGRQWGKDETLKHASEQLSLSQRD